MSINQTLQCVLWALLEQVWQVVSQVWGLVVGYVLPYDAHSVYVVVHQCWDAILGRDVGGEDVKVCPVRGIIEYYLLTPVAEEVCLQAWSSLCTVA